jgi:hypothetical protein
MTHEQYLDEPVEVVEKALYFEDMEAELGRRKD